MYIIGFNGPPHCGKDTLANALNERLGIENSISTKRVALSLPMRLAVYSLLNCEYSEMHYNQYKDTPQDLFRGNSIRDEMISLSEDHIKRRHGDSFWARHLLRHESSINPLALIVSDMGFQAESDYFDGYVGPDNYTLVRLYREGCDWSKDSRGYIQARRGMDYRNDDTVEAGVERILEHVKALGWRLA